MNVMVSGRQTHHEQRTDADYDTQLTHLQMMRSAPPYNYQVIEVSYMPGRHNVMDLVDNTTPKGAIHNTECYTVNNNQ